MELIVSNDKGTQVKIVEHSLGACGRELITFQLKYQRFVHAEIMTHRAASRNASSSRAIPVKKLIQKAVDDPAMFASVRTNAKGMQPGGIASPEVAEQFNREWLELRDIAIEYAQRWSDPEGMNVAKELVNRAVEPWHHIEVVFTISRPGLDNLYELRDHPMAQKEFEVLAKMMRYAHGLSVPKQLEPGQWHLPYIHEQERINHKPIQLLIWSVARCARVSYMNHDGKQTSPEEDESLFERLAMNDPPHMSPLEHQACIAPPGVSGYSGNLEEGWVQLRKVYERMRNTSLDARIAHLKQFVNYPINLAT